MPDALSPVEWAAGVDWASVHAALLFGSADGGIDAVRAHTDLPIHIYDPGGGEPALGVTIHTELASYERAVATLACADRNAAAYAGDDECVRLGDEAFKDWEGATRTVYEAHQLEHNTEVRFGERWAHCFVAALRRTRGAVLLGRDMGTVKGAPLAVVGAGPSLERNAAGLTAWHGRGIVLAALTALAPLRRHGVEPDGVLVSDAAPELYELAERLGGTERLVLVGGMHVDPRLWSLPWRDRILAVHYVSAAGRWLADHLGVALCPIAGTVTGMGVGAGLIWGCRPIVLVGQDCAYEGDESSIRYRPDDAGCAPAPVAIGVDQYGQQAVIDMAAKAAIAPVSRTTAWGGEGEVITSHILDHYRRHLEHTAQETHEADPTYQLINATEGGARIAGWREVALARVVPHADDPMATVLAGSRLGNAEADGALAAIAAQADALAAAARESAEAHARYVESRARVEAAAKAARLAYLASKAAVAAERERGARSGDQDATTARCIGHVAAGAEAVARQVRNGAE